MPQTLEIMRAILHHAPSEIGYARLCALPLHSKAECDYVRDGLLQCGQPWISRLEFGPPEGGLASLARLAQMEIEEAMERCDDLQDLGELLGTINGTWLEFLAKDGLVFNPYTWNITHDYPEKRIFYEVALYGNIREDDQMVERLTCTAGDAQTWIWADHHGDFFMVEGDERIYDTTLLTSALVHPLLCEVPTSLGGLYQHLQDKILLLHKTLPSFGGLPPEESPMRVWSWDLESVLVGERIETLSLLRRSALV